MVYRVIATKEGYYLIGNGRSEYYPKAERDRMERVQAILEMRGWRTI